MTDLGALIILIFAATLGLMLFVFLHVKPRMRKALMPIVPREQWTDAEYREYVRKTEERDQAGGGGLNWQAHCELQRMSERAADLATTLVSWRSQVAGLEADAARLQERAATALSAGDEPRARQLVADRRTVLARRDTLDEDIERGEATLDGYRREIAALESRLGEDFRRESIARARIDGARDTIRARQLMYGTLAEAAMARTERREREADLAEAELEALDMQNQPPSLAGALEELEIERDLQQLRGQPN